MDSSQSSLVCRLCGTESNDSTINIFDKTQDYVNQIHSVFPIFIHECEPFPKKMCHKCCERLKDTYEFHSTVLDTDSGFKSKLSWMPKRKQALKNLGVPMVAIQNFNIKAEPAIEKLNRTENESTDSQKNEKGLEMNNNDEKKIESSIAIESIRKNLFPSPNISNNASTRLRDIENAINDSKIQSTSFLEFSESNLEDQIGNNSKRRKESPSKSLSSPSPMFVHRTSLRRPRDTPSKIRQKNLLKNQNVNDIAGLIKSDSKLRFHVEVIVDKLPDRIVENISEMKKSLMKIKKETGAIEKRRKKVANALEFELKKECSRISRRGRIQKLNKMKNVRKLKQKKNVKTSRELMRSRIPQTNTKNSRSTFSKQKKYQCSICKLKFVSRETYTLHPCYCDTR